MMWVEVVSDRLRQGELGPGGQVDEGLVHSGGDEGLFSRKFCGGKAWELGPQGLVHSGGDVWLLSSKFCEGRGWELGPGGQVGEGLGHSGGDEGLFSSKFCEGRCWELGPGGQVGEGLGHSGGDENMDQIDNTIVPNDAQANSQYLLTILETRGEILDRVEKDNIEQIDHAAELADVTSVPSLSLI